MSRSKKQAKPKTREQKPKPKPLSENRPALVALLARARRKR